ncbi:MAG: carboxypeptidase-like regulatory domain-containing protein [Bacteroidetes bacterium]|nr:carboxypeptidase-like regulatory domain-containing protein [Bacteroidota bacterium]
MKTFKILILLFFLSTIFSFAQNIKGVVLDENTNKSLIGVHVYLLKNKNKGVVTNDKGAFKLKIKSKISNNDTIVFSHIGFVSKKIPLSDMKDINNIISLSLDVQYLEKVSVISNKKLKPKIHFNKLSSLKGGLYSFGSLIKNNRIYVIGGDQSDDTDEYKKALSISMDKYIEPTINEYLSEVRNIFSWQHFKGSLQVYDIMSNTWETSSLKFRKRAYNNMHFFNDKIYVFGGKRLSKNRAFEYLDEKIEVFDLTSNSILIDDVNPHQAINFASFLKEDNLIVLGGSTKLKKNGIKEYSNKVHLYNLKSGNWFELADMPTPKETKGIFVNDKIYLIGGFNKKPLDEIESYNLETGKWKKEGQLFHGVERPALAYNDNIIYIFESGSILTYDINTKELNEYFIGLYLKSSELFYANNTLYLLGGYKEDEFSKIPSPDLFSIDLDEFNKTRINNSRKFYPLSQ